jgi:hypothetical protein
MSKKPTDEEMPDDAPSHPEEMKGTVELRFGNLATMTATGRTTPAGLIGAAILVSALLIPLAIMLKRCR